MVKTMIIINILQNKFLADLDFGEDRWRRKRRQGINDHHKYFTKSFFNVQKPLRHGNSIEKHADIGGPLPLFSSSTEYVNIRVWICA